MAIIFKEKPDSGAFDVDSRGAHLTLLFWARGSEDPTAIYDHVVLNTDAVKYGLIRTNISSPRKQGGGLWEIEVEYGDPSGAGAGTGGTPVGATPSTPDTIPSGGTALDPVSQGLEFAFDCATGTQHITKSLAVVSAVALNGGTPKDTHGAIGLTFDGKVQGCDIESSSCDFTITAKKSVVTLDTLKQYASLATPSPKTNDADWGPFLKGEVLYRGFNAQGTQRGEWTFNHRFKYAPKLTNVSVFAYEAWQANTAYAVGDEVSNGTPAKRYRCITAGISGLTGPTGTGSSITDSLAVWTYVSTAEGITVGSIEGHDYLDVHFAPDPVSGLSVPIAAYVHRVYERGDFSLLEVGV